MSLHHDTAEAPDRRPFLKTPAGWVLIGFLAIGGFYLITEHTAHLFGILPCALLLACPLMHLFMHHGHGEHGGHGGYQGHNQGVGSVSDPVSSKDNQP
jgi:hypothetical protein